MTKKSIDKNQMEEENIELQEEKVENKQAETETLLEEEPTEKITTIEEELAKEKDRYLRLFAEFENYKKRTAKERIEFYKTANQEIMQAILPVLDDFERALMHIEEDKEAEELRKGVVLIYQKLVKTLEQKGLKAMEVKKGDSFNADIHEAISQVPAPSKDLKGKIIDMVEKGYTLGDKVIRFPKVVIGQ